jgi:hypothetical protein
VTHTRPEAVLGPTAINVGCNSFVSLRFLKDQTLDQFVTTGACTFQLTGPNITPVAGTMSYLAGTKGWWQGLITGGQTAPLIAGRTYTLTVTFQSATYFATWQANVIAQYQGSAAV